jgi:hypothetical protein
MILVGGDPRVHGDITKRLRQSRAGFFRAVENFQGVEKPLVCSSELRQTAPGVLEFSGDDLGCTGLQEEKVQLRGKLKGSWRGLCSPDSHQRRYIFRNF